MCQRPDVFPREFLAELESLQRDAPKHTFLQTRRTIEGAYENQSLEDVFRSFDFMPLASGSIAQVHRAVYHGQSVVVKVCHPNIEEQVRADLDFLRVLIRLGSAWGNNYCRVVDITCIMREMLAQCDLQHERTCLETMAKNFGNNPLVHFPTVLFASKSVGYRQKKDSARHLHSWQVLIETFADGIDYHSIGEPSVDPFEYVIVSLESLDAIYITNVSRYRCVEEVRSFALQMTRRVGGYGDEN